MKKMDNGKPGGRNKSTPPDRALLALLVKSDSPELRRRLSSLKDRDIAASLTYFSDFERGILFSKLPPAKTDRVKEAIERNAGVRYEDYSKIIKGVISYLSATEGSGGGSTLPDSWYRPGRK